MKLKCCRRVVQQTIGTLLYPWDDSIRKTNERITVGRYARSPMLREQAAFAFLSPELGLLMSTD